MHLLRFCSATRKPTVSNSSHGSHVARSSGTCCITSVMDQLHLCRKSTCIYKECVHTTCRFQIWNDHTWAYRCYTAAARILALLRSALFNKIHFYPSCFPPIGFQWRAPNGRERRGSLKDWVCSICSRWRPCPYELIGECAPGVQLWVYRTYPNPEK